MNKLRLHTFGFWETQDFYFKDREKALSYAEKWLSNESIQGYKLFNENNKIIAKRGKFRCLDWDKVDEYYASLDDSKNLDL